MADSQVYTKAAVYWNSKQLTEEATVTIKRTSNAQPVKTVAKGYAGASPGSPMCEISVESAVPAAGFEFDPGDYIENVLFGTLTVFAAGKTFSTKVEITDDDFKHGVDQEAKISFNARGPFAKWT